MYRWLGRAEVLAIIRTAWHEEKTPDSAKVSGRERGPARELLAGYVGLQRCCVGSTRVLRPHQTGKDGASS